jgi:membrane-bound metal-dependent hydrolase YbcI (DUF457 family)
MTCTKPAKYISRNDDYFFLCLFFLKRFFRLWVAILCLFLFFPFGIVLHFLMNYFTLFFTALTNDFAGLKAGIL